MENRKNIISIFSEHSESCATVTRESQQTFRSKTARKF